MAMKSLSVLKMWKKKFSWNIKEFARKTKNNIDEENKKKI